MHNRKNGGMPEKAKAEAPPPTEMAASLEDPASKSGLYVWEQDLPDAGGTIDVEYTSPPPIAGIRRHQNAVERAKPIPSAKQRFQCEMEVV